MPAYRSLVLVALCLLAFGGFTLGRRVRVPISEDSCDGELTVSSCCDNPPIVEFFEDLENNTLPDSCTPIDPGVRQNISDPTGSGTWVTSLADEFLGADCQFFVFEDIPSRANDVEFVYEGLNDQEQSSDQMGSMVGVAFYNGGNYTLLAQFSTNSTEQFERAVVRTSDSGFFASGTVHVGVCGPSLDHSSTPYLYGWKSEGEGYSFIREAGCAFIGLQYRRAEFENGNTAPYARSRRFWPHFHLTFDEASLAPKSEGESSVYSLQLTNEKSEITYIDSAELWVADVPEGYTLHADFRQTDSVYFIRTEDVVSPTYCQDHLGNDCLSDILHENDGQFWVNSIDQTPSHIEFGVPAPSAAPQHMRMVIRSSYYRHASVWHVYPRLTASRSTYDLWQRINGTWHQVPYEHDMDHYADFPRKDAHNALFDLNTFVVDMSGFSFHESEGFALMIKVWGNDIPVRIDSIAFEFNEDPAFEVAKLKPLSADLHHRGVSDGGPFHSFNLQDSLDYYNVHPNIGIQKTVGGRFTRYGDVLPLLETFDDEYAITGRGDEITLRFAVPEFPDGAQPTRRFFAFYSGNWYKAENRAYGRTVEPLPFFDMPGYPYDPELYEYDYAAHQEYLDAFNTREIVATADHLSLITRFAALTYGVSSASALNGFLTSLWSALA